MFEFWKSSIPGAMVTTFGNILIFGITYFVIQRKLLPENAAEQQISKEILAFHEKYLKLQDRLIKAKLTLTLDYKMGRRSFAEYRSNMPNAREKNVLQLKRARWDDVLKSRDRYYASRTEYQTAILALICLYFEEIRYINVDLKSELRTATKKRAFLTFAQWLESTSKEIKNHIRFLDDCCSLNQSAHNDVFSDRFEQIDFDKGLQEIKALSKIQTDRFESEWLHYKSNSPTTPDFNDTIEVFFVPLNITSEFVTLGPFWLSDEEYAQIPPKAA